jgi:hypothetical protein
MPFAHFCAADHAFTKEFASKMVALLVAVLCVGLGNDWELVDSTSLPEPGTPLSLDREAYEDLVINRKQVKADDNEGSNVFE